ncbi:MAG: hypothetical protein J6T80_02000 [Paludibacteraceae bacterium]|nr:hypothetical protein [Paludibacteraceae bacterium]
MKRYHQPILIALIVLASGISLVRVLFLVLHAPRVPVASEVNVSQPSPVAVPHLPFRSHAPLQTAIVTSAPSRGYMESSVAMPSSGASGLVRLSDARVSNIGSNFGAQAGYAVSGASSSSSQRGISYSGASSMTMPMTTFVAMASARQVSQPAAAEAPAMAHVAAGPRNAPGPPNIDGPLPEDNQLIEHPEPLGDVLIPLLIMGLSYCAAIMLRKRKKALKTNDPR